MGSLWQSLKSTVYDYSIVWFTSTWYEAVLKEVPPNSHILDIGIGTGAALFQHIELLKEKNIKVTGVDIDLAYINRAKQLIEYYQMEDRVTVHHESIFDFSTGGFDCAYFSGSFMIIPDSSAALKHVLTLLKPKSPIYFTQTFEKQKSIFLEYAKPWFQYVTTIDFGQVTYLDSFLEVLEKSGVEVLKNEELSGSRYRSARFVVSQEKS